MEQNSQVDVYLIRVNKLISLIKKRGVFIVGLSMLIAMAVFLNSYYQNKVYVASLNFVIENENRNSNSGISGIASQFGIDMTNSESSIFSGSNINEFLKSRSIIEKTLTEKMDGKNESLLVQFLRMNLKNTEDLQKSINIVFDYSEKNIKKKRSYDSLMNILYNEIITNRLNIFQKDKKVSIITIQMLSNSEVFSKCFVESLIRVASEYYTEVVSKKAQMNVEILQKQIDSVRLILATNLSGIAKVSDNTFNLNPAFTMMKVPASKSQVDVQISSIILNQLISNLEVAKINLRKETPLIQVIDYPKYPLPIREKSIIRRFFFAFFFSLFFCTALVLVKQQFDFLNIRYKQISKNNGY